MTHITKGRAPRGALFLCFLSEALMPPRERIGRNDAVEFEQGFAPYRLGLAPGIESRDSLAPTLT
jgi:hypothetical protein